MASAAPATLSSKKTTNYARLSRLLVDVGTQALRDTLDVIHPPQILHAVLAANKPTLQSLRSRRIINATQWGKLFPVIPSAVSSKTFDITLLMILLRNLGGLPSPTTGWGTLPAATDTSREADIVRLNHFRNTVYAHAEQASVEDATFSAYWQEIRDTLVRLGGVRYRGAIDNLETECMDPEMEDHYKRVLSEWKKDEDNIKDDLIEIGAKITDVGNMMINVMKKLDDLTAATVTNRKESSDEESEQKVRELEQIKLEEEIREEESKFNYATELDRYEMGEAPRGICLVINNYNFLLDEDERQGAILDEEAIACLFSDLHFIVEIRHNLGAREILKVAQEMAAKDHSNYAAFVFYIMSHSDTEGVIYGVDNRKAGMTDLMYAFSATNCPTLENKPKLFLIQACQWWHRSAPRMSRLSAPTADNIAKDTIRIIHSSASGVSPREADFLLAFATVPGYKAWRSRQVGSWFIQELVFVIRIYHRHNHLLDMLTEVNKRVADIAKECAYANPSFQVPTPIHTLRAQVFL